MKFLYVYLFFAIVSAMCLLKFYRDDKFSRDDPDEFRVEAAVFIGALWLPFALFLFALCLHDFMREGRR